MVFQGIYHLVNMSQLDKRDGSLKLSQFKFKI